MRVCKREREKEGVAAEDMDVGFEVCVCMGMYLEVCVCVAK